MMEIMAQLDRVDLDWYKKPQDKIYFSAQADGLVGSEEPARPVQRLALLSILRVSLLSANGSSIDLCHIMDSSMIIPVDMSQVERAPIAEFLRPLRLTRHELLNLFVEIVGLSMKRSRPKSEEAQAQGKWQEVKQLALLVFAVVPKVCVSGIFQKSGQTPKPRAQHLNHEELRTHGATPHE